MALALVVLTLKLSCIRHVAVFVVVVADGAVVPVAVCRLRCYSMLCCLLRLLLGYTTA